MVTYLAVALRCLIGAVFFLSLVGKLIGREAFRDFTMSLRGMPIVPPTLVRPVALAVVIGEVLVLGLLAMPAAAVGLAGFIIAAGLLAAFTVGIVDSIRHGERAPCRCFGSSSTPLGTRHVVRNALLIGAALTGVAARFAHGTPDLGGGLVAAVAGLIVGGLVAAADDIASLFMSSPSGIPTAVRRRDAAR